VSTSPVRLGYQHVTTRRQAQQAPAETGHDEIRQTTCAQWPLRKAAAHCADRSRQQTGTARDQHAISCGQARPVVCRWSFRYWEVPRAQSQHYVRLVRDATDETLLVYEQRADDYAAASAPAVSAQVACLLDAVLARLRSGSQVLEVGTGPGREAAYLEEHGITVDRTDATAAFVERLRADGHDARLLDVRDGDLGGPYDAVLAHAVLLHLGRAHMRRALDACLAAVRPGGLLALTLKDGDGESWSDAKLGAPRWFVYWREDALRDLLSDVGWRVLDLRKVQGRTEPWLHVLCER